LQQVADAGACYLVSAVNFSDAGFHKFAGRLAMIPGCGSATEVVTQFGKGANLCKVFPARQLGGPAFVKAIDPALHKMIGLVPTGGTNATNIPEYVDAGVLVLGGSFSLIDKATMQKIVEEHDYKLLAKELTVVKQLIDRARREKYPDLDFESASLEQIAARTGRQFNVT
jgi:2-dehydro-3-deoxyphosphogluconate aldolase/(4S)-4-hydroxy-2-oxoglutarate aldolase